MSTTIEAQKRAILGKKVKQLRKQGLLPATVYGKGFEPASVQLDERAFNLTYRKAGKTTLIDLMIDGVLASVFVQAVQRHPVTRNILHVDFKVVDLKKAVHVEVPVIAIGESPLVARGDAMLNHVINTVMVEALPAELPQHIEVDISALSGFDKSITVADLPTGGGYKVLNDADQVVLSLTQMRATAAEEAEEAAAEEAAAAGEEAPTGDEESTEE
jgi:large subunit ribosomal protein L25